LTVIDRESGTDSDIGIVICVYSYIAIACSIINGPNKDLCGCSVICRDCEIRRVGGIQTYTGTVNGCFTCG